MWTLCALVSSLTLSCVIHSRTQVANGQTETIMEESSSVQESSSEQEPSDSTTHLLTFKPTATLQYASAAATTTRIVDNYRPTKKALDDSDATKYTSFHQSTRSSVLPATSAAVETTTIRASDADLNLKRENENSKNANAKIATACSCVLLAVLIITLIVYYKRAQCRRYTCQKKPTEQQEEDHYYSTIDCDRLRSTTFRKVSVAVQQENDYLEPQPLTRNGSYERDDRQEQLYAETYEMLEAYGTKPTANDYSRPRGALGSGLQDAMVDTIEENLYWEPATTVETLYAQLDETSMFVHIERSSLALNEEIGSGQFGSVSRATWTNSGRTAVVAVKILHSESSEERVRFLQEGVIMGQFQHKHIVSLCGVVLEGQPIMAVLEYMANGDVRQYLQSIRHNGLDQFDNLASRLLNMAREIAEGMKYLSKKCFIHRDLAARNVMLDDQLTCKIGDFGMSRDLAEDTYYITHGGKIPIRWTAPEAVVYKKYSTASDVWSYGIVLYEMWTIGEKPYGYSWSNNDVIEMLEKGYRLSPPPGCSRPVYELMISCWHPDHHQRPSFHDVTVRLAASNDGLLSNRATSEPIRGCLGDCLDDAAGTYLDLQETYSKVK